MQSLSQRVSVALYALIRAKQLVMAFHGNQALLLFWVDLFNDAEL